MPAPKVVIVVQQESLRERPRIHKVARLLEEAGHPLEIWKFGPPGESEAEGMPIHNLMDPSWRGRSAVLRYLVWMAQVFRHAASSKGCRYFIAVGFDSAFPLAVLPSLRRSFLFDNIDNVSMSYRWPWGIKGFFRFMERWVAWRAAIHVNPSQARWPYPDPNLRVVMNTPSRRALAEARRLAEEGGMVRDGNQLVVYLNGWLSGTRGIQTLTAALMHLRERGVPVHVLTAGRPASSAAEALVAMPEVTHLGMLTNDEALAVYFRSDLAFIYYDPSVEINRLAESQKWTDCWATGTPFISNREVLTLAKFIEAGACFDLAYGDPTGLADLLETLHRDRDRLNRVAQQLKNMQFGFWDDEMRAIIQAWVAE
jgi:hypothetical protein